jgi:uncharacterized membrane protein
MRALIVMGTLGVIIGIGLALASKIFYVYEVSLGNRRRDCH